MIGSARDGLGGPPHPGSDPEAVVRVRCDAAWDAVQDLNNYLARYVARRLTKTPAARARVVISELLDTGASAARANSTIDYELWMPPGSFSDFVTSISMNMVAERAQLLDTRIHKLNQLPSKDACRAIVQAVAQGKEDESVLPLARIRSEGMRLQFDRIEANVKITALTR